MYAHRFLPAKLAGVWLFDNVVPGYPVQQLNIIQMNVNRVRIDSVMSYFPNLGPVIRNSYRCHIRCGRQVGAVEYLSWRVQKRVQNCILSSRCCRHNFQTKMAHHAPKRFEIGFIHFILQRLGFDIDTNLSTHKGIKLEGSTTLVRNTGETVTFLAWVYRAVTPTG